MTKRNVLNTGNIIIHDNDNISSILDFLSLVKELSCFLHLKADGGTTLKLCMLKLLTIRIVSINIPEFLQFVFL
jgi:hypothetical protein